MNSLIAGHVTYLSSAHHETVRVVKSHAMEKRSSTWAAPSVPRWAIAIGSFGYVGFSPVASGTVASVVAAALYYLLPLLQQNLILIAVSLVLMMAGGWAAVLIVSSSEESDPSFVVSDEVVGQWIALVTPIYQGNLLFVLLSFVFFRLFDIGKPFPASYFQRKKGAIYIMLDDVVAGIYANLSAHLLLWSISSIWSIQSI